MVENSRTTAGAGTAFQPLNMPVAVDVRVSAEGRPIGVALARKGRRSNPMKVDRIVDLWDVEDEWWRKEPVRRRYFRVLLEGGRVVTLFRDLKSGSWFQQEY